MTKSRQERLDWLLAHQPNNLVAINALMEKLPAKKASGIEVLEDNGPLDEKLWPMDERVIEWARRFWEQWIVSRNADLFPKGGSTVQFAVYCLFLKRLYEA